MSNNPYLLGFLISILGLVLLFINAILFTTKVKIINKKIYTVLTVYLAGLFVVEFFCNIIGFLNPSSNFFLSHFYFITQFILLSLVFYRLFKSKKLQTMVVVNSIIVLALIIYSYIDNPALFWEFNLFEIVATSLLLIMYSLYYIYKTLGEEKHLYYLLVGLIMYLVCSCLIFLSGNYELVFIKDPYIDIWIFNSIFYIIYQLLIFKEWRYINKQNSANA